MDDPVTPNPVRDSLRWALACMELGGLAPIDPKAHTYAMSRAWPNFPEAWTGLGKRIASLRSNPALHTWSFLGETYGLPVEMVEALFSAAGRDRDDGLTEAEGKVADHAVGVFNSFGQLPVQHPSDLRDIGDAVHRIQDILCTRIARRHYPKGWPIKGG